MRAEAVGPSPTARVRVPTVQRHRATAVGEAVRAASDSPAGCPTAVGQGTRAGGLLPAAPASGNPPGSRFGNLLGASPASRSSTGSRRAPCEGRRGNLREDVEQAVPASGSPPSPMRPACPNRYGKRLARRLRLAVAAAGRRARLPWADGGGGSRRGYRRVQAVRGVVRERQVSAASARVRADRLWAVWVGRRRSIRRLCGQAQVDFGRFGRRQVQIDFRSLRRRAGIDLGQLRRLRPTAGQAGRTRRWFRAGHTCTEATRCCSAGNSAGDPKCGDDCPGNYLLDQHDAPVW